MRIPCRSLRGGAGVWCLGLGVWKAERRLAGEGRSAMEVEEVKAKVWGFAGGLLRARGCLRGPSGGIIIRFEGAWVDGGRDGSLSEKTELSRWKAPHLLLNSEM